MATSARTIGEKRAVVVEAEVGVNLRDVAVNELEDMTEPCPEPCRGSLHAATMRAPQHAPGLAAAE
jgi:hypothetical protein